MSAILLEASQPTTNKCAPLKTIQTTFCIENLLKLKPPTLKLHFITITSTCHHIAFANLPCFTSNFKLAIICFSSFHIHAKSKLKPNASCFETPIWNMYPGVLDSSCTTSSGCVAKFCHRDIVLKHVVIGEKRTFR